MKISIKFKFSVFLGLLLLTTIGILSLLVLSGIKDYQQAQIEEYLAGQSKIANIYINQNILSTENINSQDFMERNGNYLAMQVGTMTNMHIILYNSSGSEVGNSLPLANKSNIEDLIKYALGGRVAYQSDDNVINYTAPIINLGNVIGAVQFNYLLKANIDFYNSVRDIFLQIGAIIFILSFIVGYLYYNRFANTILRLKESVDRIKEGKYINKAILSSSDELGELSQGIFYMSQEIGRNINGLNEEQQKLRLAIDKLQKLEKEQKQFIENITHEFKTPLTSIKAYNDLLQMYPDDTKLLDEAKLSISAETERLYEMVEKVLKLASTERYDFEVNMEPIDIKEILEEICYRMMGKIKKFGLSFSADLTETIILSDRESLVHIFVNLIDNAIKYNSENGEILIRNYIEKDNAVIELKDTGIGIPMESIDKIFEPFYTANKDRSRKTGGTGLGLSLVKSLVTKLNGQIHIKETSEKGTTFLISFPLYK